jgi:NAD(P)-dependent dehydrogenase (short-subunit alcohol dehydrogenase family)
MNTDPKHILVTGGLGDIGLGTTIRLATDGHRVTVVDLLPLEAGTDRLDTLVPAGVRHRVDYSPADVTDRQSIRAVIDGLGWLDVVIANAGMVKSAPILDVTDQDWNRQLQVNLTGAFITAQTGAQRFVREGRPGLLLFTGSWVGSIPWPEITAYTASKAGLEMLMRQFARELATHRVRANLVAPGIVNAGMARVQLETEPQFAARATRLVPLGELQTVDQVAAAFSFLCSSDADYMTGSTLLVDGGASLYAFD